MSRPRRRPLEPRFAWRCWLEERRAILDALQAEPEPEQLQLQASEGDHFSKVSDSRPRRQAPGPLTPF